MTGSSSKSARDATSADVAAPSPAEVRWRRVAAVFGIVGVALRARLFLIDRSFWLDEALLARNIVDRDLWGLLDPLSGEQGAPVGFLWVLDLIHAVVGLDEHWLRAPAFLSGIALLPLVWGLGRRVLSERAAALAVALVAVAPGLVRYSAELKQYSSDTAIAAGLLLAAVSVDRDDRRAMTLFALGGAAAVWFSHPAVFVLAGIGSVWALRAATGERWRHLVRLLPLGAAWGASVAVLYLVNLRDLRANESLSDYWAAGYPDSLAPTDLADWAWTNTIDLLGSLGGHSLPGLVAVGVVVGAVTAVWRHARWDVAVVVAPVVVLAVAAVVEAYPYRGRLALFVLPLLSLLLAALGDARGGWGSVGIVAVCAALVAPTARAADDAVDPLRFPEARPAVEFLLAHREPGDEIYVHGLGRVPFDLYTTGTDAEPTGVTRWRPPDRCPGPRPVTELSGRAWFFFAYTHSAHPRNETDILLSHLDAAGQRLAMGRGFDALAVRYDLDAAPDPGVEPVVTGSTGCLTVVPG